MIGEKGGCDRRRARWRAPLFMLAWFAGAAALASCSRDSARYRNAHLSPAARAQDLLRRMTPEEKFWQLFAVPDDTTLALDRFSHGVYGLQVRPGPHGGARDVAARINALQRYLVTQTRLGIPMIPFEEGLRGLAQGGATVFPQAIGLAATWDTALVAAVATATAQEARVRGIRQVLSPVLNIATDVRWGRVEETYGEDPWLVSRLGVALVSAFERAGVVTTPKHFVANVGDGGRDSYPIDASERALEELHFPPFRAAIAAGGARSVMAAYNSVNGSPASANRWLLTDKLRKDWGFAGVVISDAGGTGGANVLHMTAPDYPSSAVRAFEAGLDVILQTSVDHAPLFWPAFRDRRIPGPVIDSAVARVLRLKFALGLFDAPYVNEDSAAVPATMARHRALAREAATASLVLLENGGGVIPLDPATRTVAVVGVDAVEARAGGYAGPGIDPVSIRDGIVSRLGPSATVRYAPGPGRGTPEFVPVSPAALVGGARGTYYASPSLSGTPALTRVDRAIDFSWPFGGPDSSLAYGWYSVRWDATLKLPAEGPFRLGVDANGRFRLFVDDTLRIDRWDVRTTATEFVTLRGSRAGTHRIRLEYAQTSGAGRVRLVSDAGTATDWEGDIARAVAEVRRSDVAVVVAGIEEGEFRDRASLRLPGHQEALIEAIAATGRPTVVVLVAGSAVTMGRWRDRVGAVVQAWYPGDAGGDAVAAVLFGDSPPRGRLPFTMPMAEGQLPLTYYHKPTGRGDDYADLTGRPLFPFGHGLSTTRFAWEAMSVEPATIVAGDSVVVRVRLRNEGARPGVAVVQLYLRDEIASVVRPVLSLVGTANAELAVGEEREVSMTIDPDAFSLLDEQLQRTAEPGRFILLAGASSDDLRLRETITLRASAR